MAGPDRGSIRYFVERRDTAFARSMAHLRRGTSKESATVGTHADGAAGTVLVAVLLVVAAFGVGAGTGTNLNWLVASLLLTGLAVAILAIFAFKLTVIVLDSRLQRALRLTAAHQVRAASAGDTVLAAELDAHHRLLASLVVPLNEAWRRRNRLAEQLTATSIGASFRLADDTEFRPFVERHDDDLAIAGNYDRLLTEATKVDRMDRTVRCVQETTRKLVDVAKDALAVRETYATAVRDKDDDDAHAAQIAAAQEALARMHEHRDAVVAAIKDLPH